MMFLMFETKLLLARMADTYYDSCYHWYGILLHRLLLLLVPYLSSAIDYESGGLLIYGPILTLFLFSVQAQFFATIDDDGTDTTTFRLHEFAMLLRLISTVANGHIVYVHSLSISSTRGFAIAFATSFCR